MPKNLKAQELKELESWLLTHKIIINNRTRRDYSDVGPVALLLKKFNSKAIDMVNYPKRSSFALKLANWETLNHKVLNKLGLHQGKTTLENLAHGHNGAIECLLYELMLWKRFEDTKKTAMINNIKNSNVTIEPSTQDDGVHSGAVYGKEVINVDVERVQNGKIVRVTQKMVDLDLYEHVLRESKEKDQYINSVQEKVSYLESVIKLKEDRINELTEQLTRLSVSILSKMHNLDNNSNNNSSEECFAEQNNNKENITNNNNNNNIAVQQ